MEGLTVQNDCELCLVSDLIQILYAVHVLRDGFVVVRPYSLTSQICIDIYIPGRSGDFSGHDIEIYQSIQQRFTISIERQTVLVLYY